MVSRATLADARHQAGELVEAEALFREAEAMQKKEQPEYPYLYSLRGFQYCNLLLDQDQWREVQERATQTLELAGQAGGDLISIALDHLSLGRAGLLEAQQEGIGDFTQATEHLDQAVDSLRQAGNQDFLPRGLLARAELHRLGGNIVLAQRDLEEAMSIAERGGMGLYQADCHLEYARLYLAMDDQDEAREQLATAKEMIGQMGYHRRDQDVARLAALLG